MRQSGLSPTPSAPHVHGRTDSKQGLHRVGPAACLDGCTRCICALTPTRLQLRDTITTTGGIRGYKSSMIPIVPPEIERYAELHTTPLPEHLRALAAETEKSMASAQ